MRALLLKLNFESKFFSWNGSLLHCDFNLSASFPKDQTTPLQVSIVLTFYIPLYLS